MPAAFDEFGNDCSLDPVERFRIAEEAGDCNEKCFDELLNFLGALTNVIRIVANTPGVSHRQSPSDATQDRGRLVIPKINIGLGAHLRQQIAQWILDPLREWYLYALQEIVKEWPICSISTTWSTAVGGKERGIDG